MAKRAPKPSKTPSRATAAAVTGGGSGGALAAFAQTLAEPYKTWVSISAPAVSAIVVAAWPPFVNWLTSQIAMYMTQRSVRRTIKAMDQFIAAQQKRLQDGTLDDNAREFIRTRINEMQIARAHKEHSIIAMYMTAGEPAST